MIPKDQHEAYEEGRAARFGDGNGAISNPAPCPYIQIPWLAWVWYKGYSDADTQIGEEQ